MKRIVNTNLISFEDHILTNNMGRQELPREKNLKSSFKLLRLE